MSRRRGDLNNSIPWFFRHPLWWSALSRCAGRNSRFVASEKYRRARPAAPRSAHSNGDARRTAEITVPGRLKSTR
jgi:hypothetical protein